MRSGLGVPQPRLLLTAILAAMLAAAGGWTVPAAFADEHGAHEREFHEHEFHEHEFHDQRYLDARYHHGHYYPPVGFVFGALPHDYVTVGFGGGHFYFGAGVWYRVYAPGRFVVVAPPVGVVIPVLPPFYTMVWASGVPYYYANNVYYVQTPQGYMVAAPSPSSVVVEQPPTQVSPVEQPAQTPPPPPQPRHPRRRARRSSRIRSAGRAQSSRRRIATSVTLGPSARPASIRASRRRAAGRPRRPTTTGGRSERAWRREGTQSNRNQ